MNLCMYAYLELFMHECMYVFMHHVCVYACSYYVAKHVCMYVDNDV